MPNKVFKCTLLSDLIISSHAATEEPGQSLNYIPGANFLGLVAQSYSEFSDDVAFEVFHSGKVRFGDAHLAKKVEDNYERSLKMPASWFFEKGDAIKNQPYIHHAISSDIWRQLHANGTQLKQERTSFFFPVSNQQCLPQHNVALKSARDANTRRSAEKQLYVYDALTAGTDWVFEVEADSDELLATIGTKLTAGKTLGRSRSAQYGHISIVELASGFEQPAEQKKINQDLKEQLTLYFESCAAFVDQYGQPTFQPQPKDLGLDSGEKLEILWGLCQIRTRSYAPWNGIRRARDTDRVCLDKGSVLVLKVAKDFDAAAYASKVTNGVGLHRQEGFGRILVNPTFLQADQATAKFARTLTSWQPDSTIRALVCSDCTTDNIAIEWAERQSSRLKNQVAIIRKTNSFLKAHGTKTFGKISSSQWGTVRERALRAKSIDGPDGLKAQLFCEDQQKGSKHAKGLLLHGKSQKVWRNCWKTLKSELDAIKDDEFARRFLVNLCSEMAKLKSQGGANDNSN